MPVTDLMPERHCQRAILFEGPHATRRHEADIHLLERAATTVTDTALCITTPRVVARWAEAAELRRSRRVDG